ncbi:HEAT repeat domain-containing protein [Moorena sp. SIO3I6]|uniref:HEAT repeat domain-containing protein n=2 Tax=unclassified Moorena TaxID=2683338 RepID=UPI0013F9CFAE|nr:HEAT repeat domain-containing protein [Moorena sp. SIO3I6]NEP23420.1 AAA family ATPase [Moorena sp. SIO3I6]
MNEIFLGRDQQQERFRDVLESLRDSASTSQEHPKIFLLHGFGGMGKTTLLQRLYNISREGEFRNWFNTLWMDWEKEREHYIGLQVDHDAIEPATMLEAIYHKFVKQEEWKDYFQEYSETQSILKVTIEKIKQAEEEQERTNQPVRLDLTKDESDVYRNSDEKLAEALGAGIAQIADKKPLLIFFDTYELVDRIECDRVLRKVMKHRGGQVVWVIAGRSNLADNIWRNEPAKEALIAALADNDPDIVAVAIRALGRLNALEVPQLIRFLNLNQSKDRYVREAAARQLGYMANDPIDIAKVLEAVEPLIEAMRNDYIKPVREAASEAGATMYFATESSDYKGVKLNKNVRQKLQAFLILLGILYPKNKEELEETDPAILMNNLDSSDDINERERIIHKLGKLQAPKAVRPLVDLLQDTNQEPDIRATAAAALGEIGTATANDDPAIQALLNALRDNDSFVRLQAAQALGKLIPPVGIDALYQAIRQDKFSNVRDAAKEALKKYIIDSNRSTSEDRLNAFNYLKLVYPNDAETLLQQPIPDAHVLRKYNPEQQVNFDNMSVGELIDQLNNNNTQINPDECVAIAKALGKHGDSDALEPLINKLKDLEEGDWVARVSVIEALGNLKISMEELEQTQLVQKILVDRWRNDAISDVRDAVKEALKYIYLKTGGYKPAAQALERYSDDPFFLERLKAKISSANTN